MCGIAGYIRFDNHSIDSNIIERMVDQLNHRGPFLKDTYVNELAAFGHTRLPIIDLSDNGKQPFCDVSGRYLLVFNGTIYNYRELRKELADYIFKTETDTEVLLAAYIRWGIDCIKKIDGIFSFVIWDKKNNEFFLARDSFGVKPFYYILTDTFFLFASEIRSLLASGLSTRKINKKAIYHYLMHQSVLCEENLVQGISELPPASYGFLKNGKLSTFRYNSTLSEPFADVHNISIQGYKTKIRELVSNAVRKRMVGDVPIGVFLSGGVDSSVLVAAMSEIAGANINTFTVCNKIEYPDEKFAASAIAKEFKTNHLEIALEDEMIVDLVKKALCAMDSPSGDGINTFLISKVVSDAGFRVALSGIGGDELFMGYPFFKIMSRIKKYEQIWNQTSIIRNGFSKLPVFEGNRITRKLKHLLQSENASLKELYPVFRNVWDNKRLNKLLSCHITSSTLDTNTLDFQGKILGSYPFISQITIAEYLGYSQHTLLKDTDQMGMAVSLEIREPYFDRDLVSFVLNISDEFKHSSSPKQLLIKSFEDLLPKSLVHKKKAGFTFPWQLWMRRELKDFCGRHIMNFAKRELVNYEYVIECWSDFVKGSNKFNWMELWVLVVLEHWLEKNGIDE
jgi:asparagine synthase (glutamine-hydrolysing)